MKHTLYSKEHASFLRRRKQRLILVQVLRLGVLALLLGLWELVTACGWVDPFIMSSPSRIARTIASLYADGSLFYHIGVTLWETLAGFAIAVVLGTAIVALARLVMHFFSGVIYFQNDAVWVEFPEWAVANAYIYSLIYQLIYIPADAVINIVVLAVLAKTGTLQTLLHMVRPALFPNKAAAQPPDTAPTQETAADANAKTSFPQKK